HGEHRGGLQSGNERETARPGASRLAAPGFTSRRAIVAGRPTRAEEAPSRYLVGTLADVAARRNDHRALGKSSENDARARSSRPMNSVMSRPRGARPDHGASSVARMSRSVEPSSPTRR